MVCWTADSRDRTQQRPNPEQLIPNQDNILRPSVCSDAIAYLRTGPIAFFTEPSISPSHIITCMYAQKSYQVLASDGRSSLLHSCLS